jgi:hypothetical protein
MCVYRSHMRSARAGHTHIRDDCSNMQAHARTCAQANIRAHLGCVHAHVMSTYLLRSRVCLPHNITHACAHIPSVAACTRIRNDCSNIHTHRRACEQAKICAHSCRAHAHIMSTYSPRSHVCLPPRSHSATHNHSAPHTITQVRLHTHQTHTSSSERPG